MNEWHDFIKKVEATGAKIKEGDVDIYIQLPKTVEGMRDFMFLMMEKPTPDEFWLRDHEGLEPGNTVRAWWD